MASRCGMMESAKRLRKPEGVDVQVRLSLNEEIGILHGDTLKGKKP
jgi:hypothetical protein